MTTIRSMLAFAAGAFAAVGVMWGAVEVRAETKLDPVIHACADQAGVLRLTPLASECPAGQRSLLFRRAESALPSAPKPDKQTSKRADSCPATDRDEIAALQARLKALESAAGHGSQGPSRVAAPFEVVDRAGKRIFQVAEDAPAGARFVIAYNAAGIPVAGLRATPGGGLVWGEAATRDRRVLVGAGTTFAGLDIEEGAVDSGKNRVQLGRSADSGRYSLRVNRDAGKTVAAIGENALGGGLAFVADAAGKQRALMIPGSDASRSGFYVNGGDGMTAAMLADGERGGLMQLFSGRQIMVEAGVAEGGYGVVRAGPESFKPGVGLLGLPGSYIAGKPN